MCSSCIRAQARVKGCRDGRGPNSHEMPRYPQVVAQPYTSHPRPQAVARPPSNASTGTVYPPSNFGRTPTNASNASTASDRSVQSERGIVDVIASNTSLNKLTKRLSEEARNTRRLKDELEREFQQLNPDQYRVRQPWHQGMQNAYDRYKKYAEDIGVPHKAFEDYRQETAKRTTPEQHLQRAKLAIKWGESAVKAARARLEFQQTYKDAYPYEGIHSHILEAQTQLGNAQDALFRARDNYESKDSRIELDAYSNIRDWDN